MNIQEIAALLGLPQAATLAEIAQSMITEEIACRKTGGWLSAAATHHVREICRPMVARALRPAILQPDT